MIVLSNTTAQTIPVGQAITFNTTILHTGCAESQRANSGIATIRSNGIFAVAFSANVSGATAGTPVQLNIQLNGDSLLETTMISTPSAADALNNVATQTRVATGNGCGCGNQVQITVVNTGTTDITVQNPNLSIQRVA